jgi:hypothetical protein
MGLTQEDIDQLSPHLFWDVNREGCKWELHKKWLVERILDYGLWEDWLILYRKVGLKEIGEIAKELRYLDSKSISFISALTGIPEGEFRCYILKQLIPQHWDF